MREKITWNQIVIIVVQSFFVLMGVRTILQGNYLFGIIWLLLTGTILFRTLQTIFPFLKRSSSSDFSFSNNVEDKDVYGHRTHASYEIERLRKLDELYQSRLLTKEEYEEKRKQIIDQL